jgi:hypothetical protein
MEQNGRIDMGTPRKRVLKPPSKKAKPEPKKLTVTSYILELSDGSKRKVIIPSHWKVTFGPTIPGMAAKSGSRSFQWAVRIYEAKDLQRAVFTNVKEFYDESLTILNIPKNVEEVKAVGGYHTPLASPSYAGLSNSGEWVLHVDDLGEQTLVKADAE